MNCFALILIWKILFILIYWFWRAPPYSLMLLFVLYKTCICCIYSPNSPWMHTEQGPCRTQSYHNTNLALWQCRKEVPSSTLWQDKNLTYVKPEDRYRQTGWLIQNTFLLDNFCLKAEISAYQLSFWDRDHFLVSLLSFACRRAPPITSFLPLPFP